ncbi:hypothetical protein G6O69_32885 [Pseudenhygromyxa sp. WMMC2535]|uniref:hypothetical protein n=1 Tax=Pseudenhygromyxa sp. WMMC2535 TaxID=2712867 RepID=UPI0015554D69|nr:hypothetical protein [Pseudenhygromyxa sp. WMMC2535]NVB42664.1 hypothetical protein [Pseudenhygromyxa sp. WMMC2535]
MIVSVHSTRLPVEAAGFLTLERLAYAGEHTQLASRRESWLEERPEGEVATRFTNWLIDEAGVPEVIAEDRTGGMFGLTLEAAQPLR